MSSMEIVGVMEVVEAGVILVIIFMVINNVIVNS